MDWYRIRHTIGMCCCTTAVRRADYIKKHNIFRNMGNNCMTMFRKIPLYPKLISFGDNVWIASGVSFVTHDVIHRMLNNVDEMNVFQEHMGCIEIKDNVFVCSNTTILSNVSIGPNAIIAAGSLVNKNVPPNSVVGGVPARYICNLDDLINKRKNVATIEIKRGTGGLDTETVEAYWNRFAEVKEKRE